MAHIGRGVAVDAGAPMTAAYGADGHSHQRASSAEGSESLGGRSSTIVRERLFHAITVAGKGLMSLHDVVGTVLSETSPMCKRVKPCDEQTPRRAPPLRVVLGLTGVDRTRQTRG